MGERGRNGEGWRRDRERLGVKISRIIGRNEWKLGENNGRSKGKGGGNHTLK